MVDAMLTEVFAVLERIKNTASRFGLNTLLFEQDVKTGRKRKLKAHSVRTKARREKSADATFVLGFEISAPRLGSGLPLLQSMLKSRLISATITQQGTKTGVAWRLEVTTLVPTPSAFVVPMPSLRALNVWVEETLQNLSDFLQNPLILTESRRDLSISGLPQRAFGAASRAVLRAVEASGVTELITSRTTARKPRDKKRRG